MNWLASARAPTVIQVLPGVIGVFIGKDYITSSLYSLSDLGLLCPITTVKALAPRSFNTQMDRNLNVQNFFQT